VNKKPEHYSTTSVWRHLLCNGIAVGIILALLEVCWTYLLPKLFPIRKYALPTSSIGWFIILAIIVDTLFVLAGATLLGLLISIIRKLLRPTRSFNHWNTLISFLIIAGVLSYLYRGYLYIYVCLEGNPARLPAMLIGISLIIVLSASFVWLLAKLQRRVGSIAPIVVWLFIVFILTCLIGANYRSYSNSLSNISIPDVQFKRHPNILLVTLDTLRSDHLACYGNKIVQTPVLDALAADGHLFESAFCQIPYTTPSHCSIMTSTYTNRHGARNGSAMDATLPTIAQIFQKNGYDTAALVSSGMVRSDSSGLGRGFDYYEDSLSYYTSILRHDVCRFLLALHYLSHTPIQLYSVRGYIVSNRAIAWLNKKRDAPFFCWLHYFDPHTPYEAPEPYRDMYAGKVNPDLPAEQDRTRYAGEVTYTDAQLGRVIEMLKYKELYDETLIIVTADHGEAFGEQHGDIIEYDHGFHLYDTTLRVPLIIKLPAQKGNPHRISDIVQLIDIAPTLLDLLGAPPLGSFQGASLRDLLESRQRIKPGIAYSETSSPLTVSQVSKEVLDKRRLMSMRTADIKYIRNITGQRQELYDIDSDPLETKNIYAENSELAKSCYRSIVDTIGSLTETETTDYDQKVLDELRSLGYVE
jgi:arylsulfatase A-like enzyme